MLETRALFLVGIISCSAIMCSGKDRTFPGRHAAEAGQAGEAGEDDSQGGRAEADGAGAGGVEDLGASGSEAAGESSAGGAAAGEAGAGGTDVSGAGQGSSGGTAASGASAGMAHSSAGTAAAGASGTAGGSGCPSASSRCVQVPPEGWTGPLLVTANAVNSCPREFPTKSPTLYAGLVSGNASCACNCGAATVSCSGTSSVTFYNEASCNMSVYGSQVSEGACRQESGSVSMSYSGQAVAKCSEAVVQPSLPVPTWTQSLNACTGAQAQGTCSASNQVCVANASAPFAAKYCISRAGDQTCPAAYPLRSLLYAGYQDTRACPSTCSCSASGQSCALQVDVYNQASCSGSASRKTVVSGSSSCVISSPSQQHAYYASQVVASQGTCSANGTLSVTGTLGASDPTTLCCTE